MMVIWDWLVAQGLYHDLVSACILVPILKMVSSQFAKRVAREIASAIRDVLREADSEVKEIKDKVDEMAD